MHFSILIPHSVYQITQQLGHIGVNLSRFVYKISFWILVKCAGCAKLKRPACTSYWFKTSSFVGQNQSCPRLCGCQTDVLNSWTLLTGKWAHPVPAHTGRKAVFGAILKFFAQKLALLTQLSSRDRQKWYRYCANASRGYSIAFLQRLWLINWVNSLSKGSISCYTTAILQ